MADGTIFDQSLDTAGPPAAARFIKQETSAATASDATSFALMGGLEVNNQTITTTDVTGAVGQLYVCTIAGLTAERNLTLPSAQVGERIGVYVVDGDATYELVLKGAASQTINGGTAATEWSRVFIANECVIFRCTAANTWIVEYDGRIPCIGGAYLSSTATNFMVSAATWYQVELDTATTNNYSGVDTSEYHILVRRAGDYLVSGRWGSGEVASSGAQLGTSIRVNNGASTLVTAFEVGGANAYPASGTALISMSLSAGDTVEMWAYNSVDTNYDVTGSASKHTHMEITEELAA